MSGLAQYANSLKAAQAQTAVDAAALASAALPSPRVRHLGRVEYEPTWRAMQRFTAERDASTPDAPAPRRLRSSVACGAPGCGG